MANAKLPLLFLLILVFSLLSFTGTLKVIDTEPYSLSFQTVSRLLYLPKDDMSRKSRKLLEADLVQLDYDYAGPNPKHDPKRGRGGGRNP